MNDVFTRYDATFHPVLRELMDAALALERAEDAAAALRQERNEVLVRAVERGVTITDAARVIGKSGTYAARILEGGGDPATGHELDAQRAERVARERAAKERREAHEAKLRRRRERDRKRREGATS